MGHVVHACGACARSQWLRQMGAAASKAGITVQYCMPWPRHVSPAPSCCVRAHTHTHAHYVARMQVLASTEIAAVTQIRVSDDYNPGAARGPSVFVRRACCD